MNRDNHDKQMLRAMQRIARSLESLLEIQMMVHEDLISKPREASKTTCADCILQFTDACPKGGSSIGYETCEAYAGEF